MKRILGILAAVLFVSATAQAEEMSFVTVLSSPLGSFSNLETAKKATARNVNFATRGSGEIDLVGGNMAASTGPVIQLMNGTFLRNATAAAKVTNMHILNTSGGLVLGNNGKLKGSRLIAKTLSTGDTNRGIVNVNEQNTVLYNATTSVAGAKTNSLKVNNGGSVMGPAFDPSWSTPATETLEWSNVFQVDNTGAVKAEYKKQFLLTRASVYDGVISGDDDPVIPPDTCTNGAVRYESGCGSKCGKSKFVCTDGRWIRDGDSCVSEGDCVPGSYDNTAGPTCTGTKPTATIKEMTDADLLYEPAQDGPPNWDEPSTNFAHGSTTETYTYKAGAACTSSCTWRTLSCPTSSGGGGGGGGGGSHHFGGCGGGGHQYYMAHFNSYDATEPMNCSATMDGCTGEMVSWNGCY